LYGANRARSPIYFFRQAVSIPLSWDCCTDSGYTGFLIPREFDASVLHPSSTVVRLRWRTSRDAWWTICSALRELRFAFPAEFTVMPTSAACQAKRISFLPQLNAVISLSQRKHSFPLFWRSERKRRVARTETACPRGVGAALLQLRVFRGSTAGKRVENAIQIYKMATMRPIVSAPP